MGIRHLSALEMLRLTGSKNIGDQIDSLDAQKIPYTLRRVGKTLNGMVIGINIYDCDVRSALPTAKWNSIRDRSIGTGIVNIASNNTMI